MNVTRLLWRSRCLPLLLLALLAGCGATAARRAPLALTPAAPAATTAPAASPTPVVLGARTTAAATTAPATSPTPIVLGTRPTTSSGTALREGAAGEPFELALGEELHVAAAELTLRFAGVPEDSRCPADSHCIWAGRAVVAIEASAGAGPPQELTLGLPGGITPDAPELQAVGTHTVRLVNLDPYPATNGGPPLDYVVTLIVEGL